jgi:protein-S-isoprenylcysteine O-methyltransferase Ste14
MSIKKFFLDYKPPKNLRALFIAHYSPLLLIIMIGPLTGIYGVWKMPIDFFYSILIGLITFFIGSIIYFKWSIFWHKNYKGQLVTDGIFKYIRHPHYTSLIIVGFGLAFFFYSLAALLIAIIAVPIMVWSIIDEERILIKQYGYKYKEFMRNTPWRIIPKIF